MPKEIKSRPEIQSGSPAQIFTDLVVEMADQIEKTNEKKPTTPKSPKKEKAA